MARNSSFDTGDAPEPAGNMAGGDGMAPRKMMAGGTSRGDFGCESFSETNSGGRSMGSMPTDSKPMPESERGAGTPINYGRSKMPAQAAPDHGKHR